MAQSQPARAFSSIPRVFLLQVSVISPADFDADNHSAIAGMSLTIIQANIQEKPTKCARGDKGSSKQALAGCDKKCSPPKLAIAGRENASTSPTHSEMTETWRRKTRGMEEKALAGWDWAMGRDMGLWEWGIVPVELGTLGVPALPR
jgi:hypothetical protein